MTGWPYARTRNMLRSISTYAAAISRCNELKRNYDVIGVWLVQNVLSL